MKIYDCFTFYNELDLLKIRIDLLKDVVDKFVLVEMNVTQTGIKKDFIFEKNKDKFEEYKDKIIHIKVDNPPKMRQGYDNWLLENYQRNNIMSGLTDCQADDLVIISDLDEIPKPEILRSIKKIKASFLRRYKSDGFCRKLKMVYFQLAFLGMLDPRKLYSIFKDTSLQNVLEYTPVILEQDIFYYFMNCRSKGILRGSVIVKYKNMVLPNNARRLRFHLPVVKNAGWHFSYLGGVESIKLKLDSIVEGGMISVPDSISQDEYICGCLNKGVDLFGRTGAEFEYEFIQDEKIGLENVKKIRDAYPNLFR